MGGTELSSLKPAGLATRASWPEHAPALVNRDYSLPS